MHTAHSWLTFVLNVYIFHVFCPFFVRFNFCFILIEPQKCRIFAAMMIFTSVTGHKWTVSFQVIFSRIKFKIGISRYRCSNEAGLLCSDCVSKALLWIDHATYGALEFILFTRIRFISHNYLSIVCTLLAIFSSIVNIFDIGV